MSNDNQGSNSSAGDIISSSSSSKQGSSGGGCSLSVTAMMVRDAVEELEKRRERVPLAMLLTHFQLRYPVESDPVILKRQLVEQAEKAVKLGWLWRYSDNTYGLTTLRWQATAQEWGFD